MVDSKPGNTEIIRPGIILNAGKKNSSALVWAPFAQSVAIETENGRRFELSKAGYGYWESHDIPLKEGDIYFIRIDNEKKLPDPASLSQPQGVHGPSCVVDIQKHQWKDNNWKGPLLQELIIYELHTGTFSETGNFSGIAEQLDKLIELGINALEIMPVARFPGHRNWGYDGVFPFAVHNSYGGAVELQRLVDACHAKGLAVILDVVYNHLGPEGNYLNEFGPYFTDKYKTPWGEAINFDDALCDGVKDFFIGNALMWLRDFHIDGLRLDAVHAIKDAGAEHFLAKLKKSVEHLSAKTGRSHFIIAESDLNDVRYINPFHKGGYNLDTQWCDEFHHALHAFVTDETDGYYSDFGGIDLLVKTMNQAYVYDGIFSPHRKKVFGSKTTGQPGSKFVVFAQNHDQVGNRMLGKRLSALVTFNMQKVVAAFYLLSPYIPMLFMGEEYGEKNPFLYFTSHSDPELINGVRQGRKQEFKDFLKDREPPDPQAEKTFLASKLTPRQKWDNEQFLLLAWYKKLIRFRKSQIFWAGDTRKHFRAKALSENVLVVTVKKGSQHLKMVFNFGKEDYFYKSSKPVGVFLDSASVKWGGTMKENQQEIDRKKLVVLAESVAVFHI